MMDNETKMRVFADYKPTELARELAGDVIVTLTDPKIDDYDEKTEHVFLAFSAVIAEATNAELERAELEMWTKIASAVDDIAPSSWGRGSVIAAIGAAKPARTAT
jgi:hypothetical protein